MKLRLTALRPPLLSLILTTALACGGSGGSNNTPLMTSGMLGEPSTAVISNNLIFVNASMNMMDQTPGIFGMLVDTGSPVVLIDPTLFNAPPPTTNAQIATKVDLGLLNADVPPTPVVVIEQAPVLQVSNAMMDGLGFGGILGGSVMRQFSVQLDYAAPMMEGFCLGCTAVGRADVLADNVVPFTLKGGGDSAVTLGTDSNGNPINSPAINIPPTRIVVAVAIDGTAHTCIVDSGATQLSIRSTVYDALVADGRAQLSGGIAIMTIAGPANAEVTRAKTITVGSATISDPPVMSIMTTPPDQLLGNISNELKTQIDCLLGGSFLRNFLVTIDYPATQLHLEPYLTPPIPDEFRRAGFTIGLATQTGPFVVTYVYPGSDAASQGIAVGDDVVAIDGNNLMPPIYVDAADQLLDGTPGTTKTITFGATKKAANSGQTLTVLVDDLIPNP
jgi:Aspartyl protease/PDZ domain